MTTDPLTIHDQNQIIVSSDKPHNCIDIVDSKLEVAAAIERLTPTYGDQLIAVSWDQHFKACREFWLTPPAASSESEFMEMLEVLPPDNWHHDGIIESFTICELTSGPFTMSFAKLGKQYISKMVDLSNRSTFIDHADFATVYN